MLSGMNNNMYLSGEWRYDKIVILKNYRKVDIFQLITWFITNIIGQVFATKAACAPTWRAQLCTETILFDLIEPFFTFVITSMLLSGVYWKLNKVVKDDPRKSINKATVAYVFVISCYIILLFMCITFLLVAISIWIFWIYARFTYIFTYEFIYAFS